MYFVSVYCVLAFDSKDVHNRARAEARFAKAGHEVTRAPARRGSRRTVREAFAKRCIQEHNGPRAPRAYRARSARRSGNNFAQPYARQYSYAHRGHLHRVVVPATGGT